MKRCSSCQEIKSIEAYHKNQTRCKPCTTIETKARYNNNKAFVQRYKLMKGCFKCGYKKSPYALDLAHIDETTKWSYGETAAWRMKVGAISLQWSRKKIKDEIRKCKVLCANCHREETHE